MALLLVSLLACGAAVMGQLLPQQYRQPVGAQCDGPIQTYLTCAQQAMDQGPNFLDMETQVDACFTTHGCTDTPKTLHTKQHTHPDFPKPPPEEMHTCISTLEAEIVRTCQSQLKLNYNFPTPKSPPPPPPPPPFGGRHPPPHGMGHHGGGMHPPPPPPTGTPWFIQRIIKQVCPAAVQDTVKQCTEQAHTLEQQRHEQATTAITQCYKELIKSPQCLQKLLRTQAQTCLCARQQAIQTHMLREFGKCAKRDPMGMFARDLQFGRLPPHLFGPLCGPPPHGPPGAPNRQQQIPFAPPPAPPRHHTQPHIGRPQMPTHPHYETHGFHQPRPNPAVPSNVQQPENYLQGGPQVQIPSAPVRAARTHQFHQTPTSTHHHGAAQPTGTGTHVSPWSNFQAGTQTSWGMYGYAPQPGGAQFRL